MEHRPTFSNADRAKAYLVSRISEQAIREGSPLSDSEAKLLYFSEGVGTVGNEVVADFPDDNSEYESKITGLLRRRYQHERSLPDGGESNSFVEAVNLLKSGDHYILVMAEPALKTILPAFQTLSPVNLRQGIMVLLGLTALIIFGAWIMGSVLR